MKKKCRGRVTRSVRCTKHRSIRTPQHPDSKDAGFTLVELLIVVMILPLIVGAISLALISVFSLQTTISNRIADSADAQVVSSTYVKDVQSAASLTTQPTSTPECGTGNQLLGLQMSGGQTVISYVTVSVVSGGITTYSLVRQYCTDGSLSPSPSSTTTVSYDISSPTDPTTPQLPPCLSTTTCTPDGTTVAWESAAGVPTVKLVINETKSPFLYTLMATPRAWTPASGGGPTGGTPYVPFVLLNTNCAIKSNIGTLWINVGGGTGNGAAAIAAPCSAPITLSGSFNAQSLYTASPTLTTTSGGTLNATQWYTPQITDPLAATLVAPSTPGAAGSCGNKSPYTCTPGLYSANPNIPTGSTVIFKTGTYYFNAAIPLTIGSGDTVTGTQVLLYAPTGSMNFGNTSKVTLSALAGNQGVAVWDAASSAAAVTVTLGDVASQTNTYGGVYVPNGAVAISATGTLTVNSIIANTVNFPNSSTIVKVTSP